MTEIADLKETDFGGDLPNKKRAKELQGQVDKIDAQLIATLPTPEDAIRRRESVGGSLDKRMVEKPDVMKEREAREAERAVLVTEQKSLQKEKLELLRQMDDAERNIVMQKNVVIDQRLGFFGPKTVGSVAEGAVGINESYINDLKKQLSKVYERLSEIEEKLG